MTPRTRTALLFAVPIAIGLLVATLVVRGPGPGVLTDVDTPVFPVLRHVPTLPELAHDSAQLLATTAGRAFLVRLAPDQSGNLAIGLIVLLAVGLDRRLTSRNVDLLLSLVPAFLFFDVIRLMGKPEVPYEAGLGRTVFDATAVVTLVLLVRAARRAMSDCPLPQWRPALRPWALVPVAAVLLAINLIDVFVHRPDDSGFYANLGAQRLRERHALPYGDPLLTGTAGAAYAPLMYAAHAVTQSFVEPDSPNFTSPDRPRLGVAADYNLPAPIATQLTVALFHLLAVAALLVIGNRARAGLGVPLVALYCSSPYVTGMGGETDFLTGLTYVSHMLPVAVSLWAFALIDVPAASGALLAAAAGLGFYPAFMFPAFAGYQWGQDRRRALAFAAAFGGVCLVVVAWTLWLSRPAPPLGLVATILRDTLGHHTDPAGYGSSPYGIWGQRGGVMGWLIHPLVGTSALSSPVLLIYVGYLLWTAWAARRLSLPRFALLLATVAMGADLWKVHATASYVTWYYPFLLAGLLLPATRAATRPSARPTYTDAIHAA